MSGLDSTNLLDELERYVMLVTLNKHFLEVRKRFCLFYFKFCCSIFEGFLFFVPFVWQLLCFVGNLHLSLVFNHHFISFIDLFFSKPTCATCLFVNREKRIFDASWAKHECASTPVLKHCISMVLNILKHFEKNRLSTPVLPKEHNLRAPFTVFLFNYWINFEDL